MCVSQKLTGEFKEFIFHALPKVFLDKDKNVAKVQTSKCLSAPLLRDPLCNGNCTPSGDAIMCSSSKKGLEKRVLKSVRLPPLLRRWLAMDSRGLLEAVFLEGVLKKKAGTHPFREYDPVVSTLFVLAVVIAIAAFQYGLPLNVSGTPRKQRRNSQGLKQVVTICSNKV